MKFLLTRQIATFGLLTILALVVMFHLLVLAGIIPFQIVWGGRLKDADQMRSFEAVSILLNLLMLTVVAVQAGILKLRINPKLLKGALWAMAGLFLLNTAGNLMSENELEKIIFTPLTLLLSVFSFRLALARKAGSEMPVAPVKKSV